MLLSMTGFGEAQVEEQGLSIRAEIRSVNSRHLKFSCRLPEGYAALEPRVEALVRQRIRRGTIQLTLQVDREPTSEDYRINRRVLMAYHEQLADVGRQLHVTKIPLDTLLMLPGVIDEARNVTETLDHDWPHIAETIELALAELDKMRAEEGRAMEKDLQANCRKINSELQSIQQRAPVVVAIYQERLTERINQLLAEYEVKTEPVDVIREVGVFSDRVDISEEAVRLQSHLEQFAEIVANEHTAGRKLDFLIQEMFRESNTIGSKANDSEIARHVVQIKTNIERLREMIQNVE